MEQQKSFIRIFLQYLIILTGLILLVIGIFMISSYRILDNEIKDSSKAFLKIYSNECKNSISDLDGILKSIASQKEDLAKIKSDSENERLFSSISLLGNLKELASNSKVVDATIVYSKNYDICLDAVSGNITFNQKESLRKFTKSLVVENGVESSVWSFITADDQTYLCKIIKSNEQVIAVYVHMKNLLTPLKGEENGNRSMLLVNKNETIGKVWGKETNYIVEGNDIDSITQDNYYSFKQTIVPNQLTMYCFKSKTDIFQQINFSTIAVIIVAMITFLFMLFLLKYTKKEIIVPMKIMIGDMHRIKSGEYENRIDDDFSTKEFQMLKDTTNQMIDEIIGLKIQSYEKKIELQDMELMSIRLKLKPHFFLNALTTISSLSSQGKNEQIKAYINALSKNIRYLFQAGFHTVTVEEEIQHVVHYFEMQELKYPGCIFYLIDLPEDLKDYKIPLMVIQTFIENEYKYALSIDEVLTILIKISKQTYQEEEMLLIEIEDDGKGYPKEVLDYMSGKTQKSTNKGARIGLWSIKSMMELMYEKKNLVILQNIDPHGCLNRIYVPSKVKHEMKKGNNDVLENEGMKYD